MTSPPRRGREDATDPVADWDGRAYAKVSTLQQWLAQRALSGLVLDDVSSLLDVGCGDGRVTAAIAERVPTATVVGLDPSPRMLSVAPSLPNLSFELGDVGSMSHERSFDVVVSFNALHWVADQQGALERIAAALRPRGRALLVLVCRGPRASLEDVATQVATSPRWRSFFLGYEPPFLHPDPAAWSLVAERCGFAVGSLDLQDLTWDFGSREAFLRWCEVGFGAWTTRLPAGEATRFVTEVVDAYAAVSGNEGIFRFMQLRAELELEA